jgi:hypothetical protein
VNRSEVIEAWQRTLDEIAALNRRIDTCDLLIVYHRTHPTLVRLIDEIKRDYAAKLSQAHARKARLSGEL